MKLPNKPMNTDEGPETPRLSGVPLQVAAGRSHCSS